MCVCVSVCLSVCVCVCVAEECIDHNLKSVSVGTNILRLHPYVTHTFSFHPSLTRIPLCNCTLIFQCQSGLCPQPCYLLRSQLLIPTPLFSRSLTLWLPLGFVLLLLLLLQQHVFWLTCVWVCVWVCVCVFLLAC